jgi:hypothetical protein
MADKTTYVNAVEAQDTSTYFVNKEVFYVNDSNNSSYNGQINIDTSVLSNTGRWLDYSEGILEIPFRIGMKSSVDDTAHINGFSLALKNGSVNLINSIQVDLNNSNMVQQQPYTNFYCTYKMMTSWSQDDVKKHGAESMFIPDSAGSYIYRGAVSTEGQGLTNNTVAPTTVQAFAADSPLDPYNAGLLARSRLTAFTSDAKAATATGSAAVMSATNAVAVAKNYFSNDGGATIARYYYWNILATIRLKDLSDFFAKFPLSKGSFFRFTISYNAVDFVCTSTGAGVEALTSINQKAGITNPIMFASAAAANPNEAMAAGTQSISCNVASGSLSSSTAGVVFAPPTPLLTSCRLVVPTFEMDYAKEQEMLALSPKKKITYKDIYNYNITGITTGSPFNQIITNGLADAQELVIIPMINSASNGTAPAIAIVPYQSPFDSAPATTCPNASISNFNVSLSGKFLFQQNLTYDYEMFNNEIQHINALNGGLTTGLTSGLVGRHEWDNGYRFYACDLSRHLPADDGVPRSIAIQGTNNTTKTMDYICFVAFNRTIELDLYTGKLIK